MVKEHPWVLFIFAIALIPIFYFNAVNGECLNMPVDPCGAGFYAGPCGSTRQDAFCCTKCEFEADHPPPPPPPPIAPPVDNCRAVREFLSSTANAFEASSCTKRRKDVVVPPLVMDCAALDALVATVEAAQRALLQNKDTDASGLDISWLTKSAFDLSACPSVLLPYLYLGGIDLLDGKSCTMDIIVNVTAHFAFHLGRFLSNLPSMLNPGNGDDLLHCSDDIRTEVSRIVAMPRDQTLVFVKPARQIDLAELEDRLHHTEAGGGIPTEMTCLGDYPLALPSHNQTLVSSVIIDTGSDCFGGRLLLNYSVSRSLDLNRPGQIGLVHVWQPIAPNSSTNLHCGAVGRKEKAFRFTDREPPTFTLANGEELTSCSSIRQDEEAAVSEQEANLSVLAPQMLLVPCLSDLENIKIYSVDNCNGTLKEARILRQTAVRSTTHPASSTFEPRPLTGLRACSDNASVVLDLEAVDDKGNRAFCRLHVVAANHRTPKLIAPPVRYARFDCRRHVPRRMPIEAELPCPIGDRTTDFFPFHSQDAFFTSNPAYPNCENQVTIVDHWQIGTGCLPSVDYTSTSEIWDKRGPVWLNSTLPPVQVDYECLRDMPAFGAQYNDILMAMDECDGIPIVVKGKQEELLPLATAPQRTKQCPDNRQFINSWSADDLCGNPTLLEQLNNVRDQVVPALKADAARRALTCSSRSDVKVAVPAYLCLPQFQPQLGKWMIEGDNCGGPVSIQINSIVSSLCLDEESRDSCSIALDSTGRPPVLNADTRRRIPGSTIAYLEKKARPWFYLAGPSQDTLCLALRNGILHTVNATRSDRCGNAASFLWSHFNPSKPLEDESYDPLDSSTPSLCDRRSVIGTSAQRETATLSDFGVSYLTTKPTTPWSEALRMQINTLLETNG